MRRHVVRRRKPKTPAIVRQHFRRRLRERYGLDATKGDIEAIEAQITTGDGRFVWRESYNRSHWQVDYGGETILVVFDRRRNAVVTALPKLMEDTNGRSGKDAGEFGGEGEGGS